MEGFSFDKEADDGEERKDGGSAMLKKDGAKQTLAPQTAAWLTGMQQCDEKGVGARRLSELIEEDFFFDRSPVGSN